jgi:hypothetical protein
LFRHFVANAHETPIESSRFLNVAVLDRFNNPWKPQGRCLVLRVPSSSPCGSPRPALLAGGRGPFLRFLKALDTQRGRARMAHSLSWRCGGVGADSAHAGTLEGSRRRSVCCLSEATALQAILDEGGALSTLQATDNLAPSSKECPPRVPIG